MKEREETAMDRDAKLELEKEKERARVKTEYEIRLSRVIELKELTDTNGWRKFYDWVLQERKRHETMILTEEKTRAIAAHQEAIKFLRSVADRMKQPIADLQDYIAKTPLFIPEHHTRAQWNPSTGTVELTKS